MSSECAFTFILMVVLHVQKSICGFITLAVKPTVPNKTGIS